MGVPISDLGHSTEPSFLETVVDEDVFVNMYDLLDGDTGFKPNPGDKRQSVVSLDGFSAVGTRIIDAAVCLAGDSARPEDSDSPLGWQVFFHNDTLIVHDWEYSASDGQLAVKADTIEGWAKQYGQDQQPPYQPDEVEALIVLSRAIVRVRDLDE